MNGFKYIVIILFIFIISCVQNRYVQNYDSQVLFSVYKFIERLESSQSLEIWHNPQKFIINNKKIFNNDSTLKLLNFFNESYLVLKLGVQLDGKDIFIDEISYKNMGMNLIISILPISNQKGATSDVGYPVFIKRKNIKSISIMKYNTMIFNTNI